MINLVIKMDFGDYLIIGAIVYLCVGCAVSSALKNNIDILNKHDINNIQFDITSYSLCFNNGYQEIENKTIHCKANQICSIENINNTNCKVIQVGVSNISEC